MSRLKQLEDDSNRLKDLAADARQPKLRRLNTQAAQEYQYSECSNILCAQDL
jgi:hypothetical protein